MATETVAQADVDKAIARIANVQGILTVAVMTLDEELTGSPLWEVSEAIHGAIALLSDSYCTLGEALSAPERGEVRRGN